MDGNRWTRRAEEYGTVCGRSVPVPVRKTEKKNIEFDDDERTVVVCSGAKVVIIHSRGLIRSANPPGKG